MDYSIHTSAPGKTIILGEHSVVYNRPALCGVVDSCRIHTYIVFIALSVFTLETIERGRDNHSHKVFECF